MAIWVIVGASRGVGLELVRQLLAKGDQVLASVRDPMNASQLWALAGSAGGRCRLYECDVATETSIVVRIASGAKFVDDISALRDLARIDHLVLNTGVLHYPNRATEVSFNSFSDHMKNNAIGPIITVQKFVRTRIPIGTATFMSSDSGSATRFRAFEDGFAAYSSSMAALNQMVRHLAAELQRSKIFTTILAMHPGEVSSDMGHIPIGWEVEGIINPQESVSGMLRVIERRTFADTGTFWTYQGVQHPW